MGTKLKKVAGIPRRWKSVLRGSRGDEKNHAGVPRSRKGIVPRNFNLLSITTERTFSVAGRTLDDRRNQLKPDTVNSYCAAKLPISLLLSMPPYRGDTYNSTITSCPNVNLNAEHAISHKRYLCKSTNRRWSIFTMGLWNEISRDLRCQSSFVQMFFQSLKTVILWCGQRCIW